MNLVRLVRKTIAGSGYRSWVITLYMVVVAGLFLSVTLVMRGAQNSVQLGLQRMGADIVVLPKGTEQRMEAALLTGRPVSAWMAADNLDRIAAIPGVAVASPQLFLASLNNVPCCAVSELFLVVFDPKTDFTIQPWLEQRLHRSLRLGESVGGSYVFSPEGDQCVLLYGATLYLAGNLEPTGTGLDQTLFISLDTAQEMARISTFKANRPLELPPASISAVMVKLQPGADPQAVAAQIREQVPGVSAIYSPDLFRSVRAQLAGLTRGSAAIMVMVGGVSVVLIGLVFAMAAYERRRQLAVLRALGATRGFLFSFLLLEAALLALAGGILGLFLGGLTVYLFAKLIMTTLGVTFLFPPLRELLALSGATLALVLAVVTLAAVVPALRISRQDPAAAMRE